MPRNGLLRASPDVFQTDVVIQAAVYKNLTGTLSLAIILLAYVTVGARHFTKLLSRCVLLLYIWHVALPTPGWKCLALLVAITKICAWTKFDFVVYCTCVWDESPSVS